MQKNKKYNFSPELAALLEALLRQGHVVRSDATARVSSGQTTQQVRRKKEIGDTVPKTRAEGRQRAAEKAWERREQRRKSGKTIDLESSERAIAEATKPTGYTKLADFFHQFGEAAMTDALIMSGIVNPVRTAFSVVGGALGGNAVDKTMLNLTKSDEKPEGQTWSEWVNDKLGLRQGHMVGQFSNPGILLGGAVGYKTPGAIDYLVRADLARFGFTPTTLYFFRPNYLGMNGSAVGKVETSPSEAVRKAYTAPNLEGLEMTTAEPLMSASKGATSVNITRKPVGTNLNNNTNVNVLSKQYTSPIIEVRPIRQNVGNGRERIDTNIIENQVRSRLGRELNDLGPVEEETLLGSAEDLTPYTVNGDKAGGEANFYEWDYVRNNLNRKANLDNRTKEGLMTRDLSKGEVPYELEDLVENGRLKNNTALEETYSGTRGSENFFDRGDDDVTRMTKYLRTKYGVKDRKSLGNVGEDNSKNRSGVIMTNDGWLYSIDSFSPALKRLYRALKSGRRFKLLDTNKLYVRANDFGLLNRYTEHYNPDFSDLFINSKGNIPEGAKVIRVGDKYFFLNKEGRVMGSIRERTPEKIINERLPGSNQKSPNEWIKLINEEFKLNIPLARVNPKGQIEWPNLYGVLYKKGGSITS